MKRVMILIAALVVFCGVTRAQKAPESSQRLMTQIQNPDKEYRTTPFMVWNTEVSQYQIDNMLEEFRKQHFGGLFIHPRMGLETEYLSPEWHSLVRYTVKKGKEMGLDVWLYDENSYPSGFAGGHLPHEMPESYNQGQGLKPTQVDVMPTDVSPYTLILREQKGKFIDVTAQAAKLKGKKGNFFLYEKTYYKVAPWYAGTSYVDLLLPGVTQKFIDITMRGYEETLGSDLNKSIKGIFTDEPEIVSPGGIRWTPDLFERFQEAYGYDLVTNLPSLHQEVGDWKKVRHDYFELLLNLFVDRWAKPWYSYCDSKGLVWTGHYWEHKWPTVNGVTDNMAMAAWQQMPGIDMLFNQFNETSPNAQFGNVRSVKEVRSVANQLGRERVLSETYGGGGWDLTFKDMKRLGDWQFALGVNFVNQHLSHMSLLGVRKTDYPPVFSRAASWWNDYHVLNDYNARMSLAMSQGQQINDILVMEPTTSVWMYSSYCDQPQDQIKAIGQSFQTFVTTLEHAQVEYDLGCEAIFKSHGSVRDGQFVVGERAYHTFVVPPMTESLDEHTFLLLKRFIAQGGKVLAFSQPSRLSGALSEEVQALFASDGVIHLDELTSAVIDTRLRNDKIKFTSIKGGNLFHQRREFSDGEVLLLVNASMDEPVELDVTLRGKHVMRMDAFDGKKYTIPFTTAGDNVSVKTRLEPAGSMLLFVSDQPQGELNTLPVITSSARVESMRPLQIERLKENVLVLDFLDLENDDETFKDLFFFEADRKNFQKAGLPDNPWMRSSQYKREIVDMNLSSAGGFKATYKFTVTSPEVEMATMKLAVERPNLFTIKINGVVVRGGYYFVADEDIKFVAVGPYVKVGENTVEIIAEKTTVHTELGPIYVMGNFNVEVLQDKWVIAPARPMNTLKNWQALGAPFYPWEMRYSRFYDVKDYSPDKHYWVKADNWRATLVQVWVNDRQVGVIFAEPNTCDVTAYIKPGANRVELRVVGGMENFMGPHHKAHNGLTSPWDWEGVTSPRTASQYVLTPYGLLSDFEFYEGR